MCGYTAATESVRSQKTTRGTLFFPSTFPWGPGTKTPGHQVSVASIFTSQPSCLPRSHLFLGVILCSSLVFGTVDTKMAYVIPRAKKPDIFIA